MTSIIHPKTGQITHVPDNLPLAVGVKEEDGKIVDIKPYTHKVDWVDGGLSSIAYCNNCGEALFYGGEVKLSDRTVRHAKVCSGCGEWLGFFEESQASQQNVLNPVNLKNG